MFPGGSRRCPYISGGPSKTRDKPEIRNGFWVMFLQQASPPSPCDPNVAQLHQNDTCAGRHKPLRSASRCQTVSCEQACCPLASCAGLSRPQTISHLFLECPVATTVVSWLCRLSQAMTGHLPEASIASILDLKGSVPHLLSFRPRCKLRLAVLHSVWTAAQIAQAAFSDQIQPCISPSAPSTSP